MTKYQIISGIIVCAALIIFGSYLLLKRTSPSTIPTYPAETINHPAAPTPPPTVATNTNTQTVVTATSNTPIMPDQNLLDRARLLKLVNDCQVKSIEMLGSGTAQKITLKDGSSFLDKSGVAGSFAASVRDKCPIKVFIR